MVDKGNRSESANRSELIDRDAVLKKLFLKLSEFSVDEWCVWLENFIAGRPSPPILPQDDESPHTVVNDIFHHLLAPGQVRLREAVSRCFRSTQPADDPPTVLKLFTLLEIVAHIGTGTRLDAFYARLTGRLLLPYEYAGRNLHTLLLYTMGQPGPDDFLIRFIHQSIHEQRSNFKYVCACILVLSKSGTGLTFGLIRYLLPFMDHVEYREGIADIAQEVLFREGYESFCTWYYNETLALAQDEVLFRQMDAFEALLRDELVPAPDRTENLSPYGVLLSYSLSADRRRCDARDIWAILQLPRKSGSAQKMRPMVEKLLQRLWRRQRAREPQVRPWDYHFDEKTGVVELTTELITDTPEACREIKFNQGHHELEFDLLSRAQYDELTRDNFANNYRTTFGMKGLI